MKHVTVTPAVSWTALALGMCVAMVLAWRAYDTVAFLTHVHETEFAQYETSY